MDGLGIEPRTFRRTNAKRTLYQLSHTPDCGELRGWWKFGFRVETFVVQTLTAFAGPGMPTLL